jgi:uncharacterized damage-inducible protein DinB
MDGVRQLERLFAYDDWANQETLAHLSAAPEPGARALRLLNHVVAAELLWLARLERGKPPLAVWPELTLAQCAEQVKKLPRVWQDYFADLAPDDLPEAIAYVNSKGEKFESAPAYTDYIHCVRTGRLEA